MTPAELKRQYIEHNQEGHFFDRATMKFFGDTMRNFSVTNGDNVWILARKKPTKHRKAGAFATFDKTTFKVSIIHNPA